MYLRHSRVKRNGKSYTYWRRVRSVRVGGKVRQEAIAHLGELDAKGRAKASALARQVGQPKSRVRNVSKETVLTPKNVSPILGPDLAGLRVRSCHTEMRTSGSSGKRHGLRG